MKSTLQKSSADSNLLWITLNISTFLASFLFFVIQPMFGKMILPLLGGSATVWTTVTLFFQCILLIGYGYTLLLIQKFSRFYLHAFLVVGIIIYVVAAPLFTLQVQSQSQTFVQNQQLPVLNLLLMCLQVIGLPCFLLAANSTLMQHFANIAQKHKNPYHLYIASNLGSLLGLLSFPFIFEPFFTLETVSLLWKLGFVTTLVFILLSLFLTHRSTNVTSAKTKHSLSKAPPKKDLLRWTLHASLPVILFLTATTYITSGIAPIPLLWVIPLMLYLLSYVFAFSSNLVSPRWVTVLFLSVGTFFIYLMVPGSSIEFYILEVVLLFITVFLGSFLVHHHLYQNRPAPTQLGYFYLSLAVGGVLAGAAVSWIAPLVFSDYWEFPLILFVLVISLIRLHNDKLSQKVTFRKTSFQLHSYHLVALFSFLLVAFFSTKFFHFGTNTKYYRSFYGTLKVREENGVKQLLNGEILHGQQSLDPTYAYLPNSYYTLESGVGKSFAALRAADSPLAEQNLRVGIIGLGTGVLTAYCLPNDSFVFYEINPQVLEVAQEEFSYLDYCKGASVILGDARIQLAASIPHSEDEKFDLLVVDAFTDDAIPTHLMTTEAFSVYEKHLKENGLIAFHISNKFLDLDGVIRALAKTQNLDAVGVFYKNDKGHEMSSWMVLSKDKDILPTINSDDQPPEHLPRPWTDSYVNIFSSLKFQH